MENNKILLDFSKLTLYAQPIYYFSVPCHPLVAYELLLRNTLDKKFPSQFFERVISDQKVHAELLEWYYKEVLSVLSKSKEMISINIHPQQLVFPETYSFLKNLEVYHKKILVEITEHDTNQSIQDQPVHFLANAIQNIKGMKFSVALDDVGTGIYTVDYLNTLIKSVDVIKFSTLSINNYEEIMTEIDFWYDFSVSNKVRLIIEGVDSYVFHNQLLKRKIFLQQGFFLGKPIAKENIG